MYQEQTPIKISIDELELIHAGLKCLNRHGHWPTSPRVERGDYIRLSLDLSLRIHSLLEEEKSKAKGL